VTIYADILLNILIEKYLSLTITTITSLS